MTRIRQVYLFAKRIGIEDIPSALELASSIMDKMDRMQEYVINGEIDLAQAYARNIADKTTFTRAFNDAYAKYLADQDILGLMSRYNAIVYGGFHSGHN